MEVRSLFGDPEQDKKEKLKLSIFKFFFFISVILAILYGFSFGLSLNLNSKEKCSIINEVWNKENIFCYNVLINTQKTKIACYNGNINYNNSYFCSDISNITIISNIRYTFNFLSYIYGISFLCIIFSLVFLLYRLLECN